MDFLGNHYYNLKNGIIKAERLLLKDLGFCVHVKHPHKIIITYLQMLDHEKNVTLTRKAWNYMNDSLRTDVFVRFSPETIACACIFLAARTVKVNLPLRPPWWQLFDATYDEIEDISLTIMRMYTRPRRKITLLEAKVSKIKKEIQKKKEAKDKEEKNTPAHNGSFTPSHVPATGQPTAVTANAVTTLNNNNSSKPTSKTNTPEERSTEKRTVLSSVVATRKTENNDKKHERRRRGKSESDESSEYSSDSGAELPSRKYAQQRRQYEKKKRRSPSTGSENERRIKPSKFRRSVSPDNDSRKDRNKRDRYYKETNGHKNYDSKSKRRSRSRSPVKRRRSVSPVRKDKYSKEKYRSKESSRYDKYSGKIRR